MLAPCPPPGPSPPPPSGSWPSPGRRIGLLAVGAIGDGIVGAGQQPLSPEQVAALLTPTPTPAAPTATPTTVPRPTTSAPAARAGTPEVLGSAGGTVVARSTDGVVDVVSASPAQGFQVHGQPGEDPGRVRFESGHVRVEPRLSCRDGRPVADVRTGG